MALDVLVTHVDRLATVTLNRPETINAVNQSMRRKLVVAFDELARAPDVQAIILTSAGKLFARGPTSRARSGDRMERL